MPGGLRMMITSSGAPKFVRGPGGKFARKEHKDQVEGVKTLRGSPKKKVASSVPTPLVSVPVPVTPAVVVEKKDKENEENKMDRGRPRKRKMEDVLISVSRDLPTRGRGRPPKKQNSPQKRSMATTQTGSSLNGTPTKQPKVQMKKYVRRYSNCSKHMLRGVNGRFLQHQALSLSLMKEAMRLVKDLTNSVRPLRPETVTTQGVIETVEEKGDENTGADEDMEVDQPAIPVKEVTLPAEKSSPVRASQRQASRRILETASVEENNDASSPTKKTTDKKHDDVVLAELVKNLSRSSQRQASRRVVEKVSCENKKRDSPPTTVSVSLMTATAPHTTATASKEHAATEIPLDENMSRASQRQASRKALETLCTGNKKNDAPPTTVSAGNQQVEVTSNMLRTSTRIRATEENKKSKEDSSSTKSSRGSSKTSDRSSSNGSTSSDKENDAKEAKKAAEKKTAEWISKQHEAIRKGNYSNVERIARTTELSALCQFLKVLKEKAVIVTREQMNVLFAAFERASKVKKLNVEKKRVISSDISGGKEPVAIPVVCYTGNKKGMAKFNYTLKNDFSAFDWKLEKKGFEICCNCVGECGTSCRCVRASIHAGSSFIDGEYVRRYQDTDFYNAALVGCGPQCACKAKCKNSSEGLLKNNSMEVFRRDDLMGFGVRTLQPIPTGKAVVEFVGDIITKEENERRVEAGWGTDNYCWQLYSQQEDNHLRQIFNNAKAHAPVTKLHQDIYIDPSRRGNFARFVSHGEFPNLMPIRLFENDLRPECARLLFVSTQPIAAEQELFYDYGELFKNVPKDNCLCGTIGCGKSGQYLRSNLLSIEEAIEKVMTIMDSSRAETAEYEVTEKKKRLGVQTAEDLALLNAKCELLFSRPKHKLKASSREAKKLRKLMQQRASPTSSTSSKSSSSSRSSKNSNSSVKSKSSRSSIKPSSVSPSSSSSSSSASTSSDKPLSPKRQKNDDVVEKTRAGRAVLRQRCFTPDN